MVSHSSRNVGWSWVWFCGGGVLWRTRKSKISQRCLLGFMSIMVFNPEHQPRWGSRSRYSVQIRVTCGRALSCMKKHAWAGGNVRNHMLLEYEVTVPLCARYRYGRTASSWRRHRTILALMLCLVRPQVSAAGWGDNWSMYQSCVVRIYWSWTRVVTRGCPDPGRS